MLTEYSKRSFQHDWTADRILRLQEAILFTTDDKGGKYLSNVNMASNIYERMRTVYAEDAILSSSKISKKAFSRSRFAESLSAILHLPTCTEGSKDGRTSSSACAGQRPSTVAVPRSLSLKKRVRIRNILTCWRGANVSKHKELDERMRKKVAALTGPRRKANWNAPGRSERFEMALANVLEEYPTLKGIKLAIKVCQRMRLISEEDEYLRPSQVYRKIPPSIIRTLHEEESETANTSGILPADNNEKEGRNKDFSLEAAAKQWRNYVADAPVHVCECCELLCFRKYLSRCSEKTMACWPECIRNFYSTPPTLCNSCKAELSAGQVPSLCRFTFKFPDLPPCLKELNEFEMLLISPRLLFFKLVQLGRPIYGQYGIKGTVVNVPADLTRVQTALPRAASASWLEVCLKRKMEYKVKKTRFIRPEKVIAGK